MESNTVLEAMLGEAQNVVVFQPAFGPNRLGSLNAGTWRRLASDAEQDIQLMSQMNRCKAVLPPEFEANLISAMESDPTFKRHLVFRDDCENLHLYKHPKAALNFESRSDLLRFICDRLIRRTVFSNARTAIRAFGELLELGSQDKIPGFEVTFIVGISSVEDPNPLAGPYRWFPYPAIRHMTLGLSRWYLDWQARDWSVRQPGPISALVREFRWGPLIAYEEDEWPRFPTYDGITVDMLSHVLKAPLRPMGVTHIVARELMDLLGDGGTGMSYPWPEREESKLVVSHERWEKFGALLDSGGKVPDEKSSKRIGIATSRLASAARRSGPLAEQDRTLDLTIALETLLGGGGISVTESLASRAAWFLGSDADERQGIRKTVRTFYSLRSDVVHGREPKPKDWELLEQASDIVDRILEKAYQRRSLPADQEWDAIVCGQSEGST